MSQCIKESTGDLTEGRENTNINRIIIIPHAKDMHFKEKKSTLVEKVYPDSK